MILVITSEQTLPNETEIINQLFEEGLPLLHVRKPLFSLLEMDNFIHRVESRFHARLVLHSHYQLAENNGISRLHFSEKNRKEHLHEPYAGNNILSTSVHDMATFNVLKKEWDYAFISPFFNSISKKGYGPESPIRDELMQRTNRDVKLIALGGIQENNITSIPNTHVDGLALLGAIWCNPYPIEVFKACQKTIKRMPY